MIFLFVQDENNTDEYSRSDVDYSNKSDNSDNDDEDEDDDDDDGEDVGDDDITGEVCDEDDTSLNYNDSKRGECNLNLLSIKQEKKILLRK